MLANLGLPLPEGIEVEHLFLLFDSLTFVLLKLIAHDLDSAHWRLIILAIAHVCDLCEAGWQLAEPRSDIVFQLVNGRCRLQVLVQIQMVLLGEPLSLVDQCLYVRSQLFSLGQSCV